MLPIARVLVADPPWQHDDQLPGEGRGANKHYETMPTDAICKLRIPPTEPNALLFLWRLSNMPEDALEVCSAWGFKPKSEIVWNKLTKGADTRSLNHDVTIPKGTTRADVVRMVHRTLAPRHMGMGRYVRNAHETCIIATRGAGASLILDHGVRSNFDSPVGEHSEKPDDFYSIVEALSAGPYVELFARRERKGWATIGNELGSRLAPRPLVIGGAP